MVQRMTPPNAVSALRLSKEVGVSQSQLSRWLRDARSVVPMTKKPAERAVEGRPRTMEEKLRIVVEAGAIPPDELGAYLRREGVHEAELEQWRAAAKSAFEDSSPKPAGRGAEAKPSRISSESCDAKTRRSRRPRRSWSSKKSPRVLGGRGRRHRRGQREVILAMIDEAVVAGPTLERACNVVGLTERTVQRWREADVGDDGRAGSAYATGQRPDTCRAREGPGDRQRARVP